ncbi:MAG TPA: M56 family metallopeptidase [Cyclobacteriaceae bacterium]|nr:M56 family metallopeptidase [Cyclobacteriaceae bacterium]
MITSSLGWTLIHSIWQGLVIFILLKLAVRFTSRSDVRYGLGVGALVLMIVACGATFLMLNEKGSSSYAFSISTDSITSFTQPTQTGSFLATALNWIDNNIIWLIRFWVIGFTVGMMRIAAGLFYINRLRRNSHPVQDEWMHMVNSLSQSLNIKRVVLMAEAGITSPMVVGFMKPMILFPVGLLSGLTTEQVETILVHELSYVRRQDYLINLFQAVVETIFFFNPFVMLISSLIRDERENCCDDMVIAKGISPISYVKTLAQLEASRSSSTLALGISGNKNQLLNRIKRIMENSAKNDWGKGRLVPVALVFLGLICASWLSIGSEAEMKETKTSYLTKISKHDGVVSDTSREDGLKVIKSNKHRRYQPHDEFEMPPIPDVDVDIDIDEHMEMAMDAIEAVPDIEFIMPDFEFPEVPDEAWRAFDFHGRDSFPDLKFRYRADSEEEFRKYEDEFREKFRNEFKEFYEKNREQFEKMIEDVDRARREEREAAEVVDLQQMKRMGKIYSAPGFVVAPKIAVAPDGSQFWYSDDLAKLDVQLKGLNSMQAPMKIMNDQLLRQSDMLAEMSRNFDDYKDELAKMLIDDGYLDKGERMESLNINDDGSDITINGKKIKDKDQIKYRALHDKYFEPKYKREGYHRKQE